MALRYSDNMQYKSEELNPGLDQDVIGIPVNLLAISPLDGSDIKAYYVNYNDILNKSVPIGEYFGSEDYRRRFGGDDTPVDITIKKRYSLFTKSSLKDFIDFESSNTSDYRDLGQSSSLYPIMGIQGTFGIQGIQGLQGPDGTGDSLQGPQGIQGLQGLQGFPGYQDSLQGNKGLIGPVGFSGERGLQGFTGLTHDITESEFLEVLAYLGVKFETIGGQKFIRLETSGTDTNSLTITGVVNSVFTEESM